MDTLLDCSQTMGFSENWKTNNRQEIVKISYVWKIVSKFSEKTKTTDHNILAEFSLNLLDARIFGKFSQNVPGMF